MSVQFITAKYRQLQLQDRLFQKSVISKQQHFNSLVLCCLYIDPTAVANTGELMLVGCKAYCIRVGKYMYAAVYLACDNIPA